MRVGDDVPVSAAAVEPVFSVGVLVSLVLAAVSVAKVEPSLSVGVLLSGVLAAVASALSVGVLTSPVLAAAASEDPRAFVIEEESLRPVAEAAEASKVVLRLEAVKMGYGPVLKFPCRPSGRV